MEGFFLHREFGNAIVGRSEVTVHVPAFHLFFPPFPHHRRRPRIRTAPRRRAVRDATSLSRTRSRKVAIRCSPSVGDRSPAVLAVAAAKKRPHLDGEAERHLSDTTPNRRPLSQRRPFPSPSIANFGQGEEGEFEEEEEEEEEEMEIWEGGEVKEEERKLPFESWTSWFGSARAHRYLQNRWAIERFKDIVSEGPRGSSCHMAWRLRPKESKEAADYTLEMSENWRDQERDPTAMEYDLEIETVARCCLGYCCPNELDVERGEKASNRELWPNVDRDTSPDALLSTKIEDGRNLYIATNEPDTSLFDPLKDKYTTHFLHDYKELWDSNNDCYSEMTKLNNETPVEFDGYMRIQVDREVFLKGKKQIETFNDLTIDPKDAPPLVRVEWKRGLSACF
ncbi:calcium ion binding [Striga asiatica]|uniref:Calcium ion binding n=1 Tax=Striga asiatica TaxID=4170 RepID=A0A5A7RGP0_STRAF|nr:calcium ion binding [Striga asiatica]